MKNLILIITLIFLSACANMTTQERQTAYVVTGVVLGIVAISIADDNGTTINDVCHAHGKNPVCE